MVWVVVSLRGIPSRQLAVVSLLLLLPLREAAVVPLRPLPVTVLSTQPVEKRHADATSIGGSTVGAPPPPNWSGSYFLREVGGAHMHIVSHTVHVYSTECVLSQTHLSVLSA
jgi:hypothetical protein